MGDSEPQPLIHGDEGIPVYEDPPHLLLQTSQQDLPAYEDLPNIGNNATSSTETAVQVLPDGEIPKTQMIKCRVCNAMIDISGKDHHIVVKCSQCQEATPIKNAPRGKKFVRCPCNSLLICKVSSQRIGCPRINCKRIINLKPNTTGGEGSTIRPGMFTCAHCKDNFIFNLLNMTLARCPHCGRISTVNRRSTLLRAILYFIIGVVFMGMSVGIAMASYSVPDSPERIYLSYVGAFIMAFVFFSKTVVYGMMKVSIALDSWS